jgi:hypothetical protein
MELNRCGFKNKKNSPTIKPLTSQFIVFSVQSQLHVVDKSFESYLCVLVEAWTCFWYAMEPNYMYLN